MNILTKNLMTLLAYLTVMLVNLPLQAATVYEESVDGDLIDGIKVSPWISPGDSVGVLPLGSSVVNGVFGKPTGALVEDTDTLTLKLQREHNLIQSSWDSMCLMVTREVAHILPFKMVQVLERALLPW